MPLTLVEPGKEVEIARITGKEDVRRHLGDLGFVVGGKVTVISTIEGNLIIKVQESRVAISKEMASKIIV